MNQYVAPFLAFVKTLPLDVEQHVEEFHYTNPVLIIADATLSMNRQYKIFVVPSIKLIEEQNITSLRQLDNMITQGGVEAFAKVWRYNHPQRVHILHNIERKFLDISNQYRLSELESLRKWGSESKPGEWVNFGVSGIGFTTYQYLRILCAASTVKPDIHIQRGFRNAV